MAYESHPAADLFPLMDIESPRFGELTASIRDHGLREPITLYQGQILDGRNRYRACEHTGITPHFRDFDGEDPIAYVLDANLQRRDLTENQRAAIAAEALPLLEAEAKKRQGGAGQAKTTTVREDSRDRSGRSDVRAARQFDTTEHRVRQAKTVHDKAPELHKQVKAGQLDLAAAAAEVDLQQAYERYPFIQHAPNLPAAAAVDMARTLDRASEEQRPALIEQTRRWCEVQEELEPDRRTSQERLEAGQVISYLARFNSAVSRHGIDLIADAILDGPAPGPENALAILQTAANSIQELVGRSEAPIRRVK